MKINAQNAWYYLLATRVLLIATIIGTIGAVIWVIGVFFESDYPVFSDFIHVILGTSMIWLMYAYSKLLVAYRGQNELINALKAELESTKS